MDLPPTTYMAQLDMVREQLEQQQQLLQASTSLLQAPLPLPRPARARPYTRKPARPTSTPSASTTTRDDDRTGEQDVHPNVVISSFMPMARPPTPLRNRRANAAYTLARAGNLGPMRSSRRAEQQRLMNQQLNEQFQLRLQPPIGLPPVYAPLPIPSHIVPAGMPALHNYIAAPVAPPLLPAPPLLLSSTTSSSVTWSATQPLLSLPPLLPLGADTVNELYASGALPSAYPINVETGAPLIYNQQQQPPLAMAGQQAMSDFAAARAAWNQAVYAGGQHSIPLDDILRAQEWARQDQIHQRELERAIMVQAEIVGQNHRAPFTLSPATLHSILSQFNATDDGPGGVDQSVINTCTKVYCKEALIACSSKPGLEVDADAELCSICRSDYEVGVQLRQLPCGHAYHLDCIDRWLKANRTCPMCRKSIDAAGTS